MARRPTIKIVVLVLAGLLVVASAVFAGTDAPAPPRTLDLACAKNGRGKLQYVSKAKFCKPTRGELVRLPEDHPVVACRLNNDTSVRSAKLPPPAFKSDQPGMLFKVGGAQACGGPKHPNSTAVTIPRPKKTRFCAGKRRGTLRHVQKFTACKELERRVLLPAYNPPTPNSPPKANNDSATTDKDTPKAIAVLANDSDANGDDLKVASVNTTDTDGKVTKNGNGTVTYDPDGKFDSLAKGQSAQDSFKYKANDGKVDSNTATVTVTVTGSNQPPVLGGVEATALAYDTDDSATQITSSLTVSDPDDTQLAGATVSITSGHVPGKDDLDFLEQFDITGNYNSGTGVLTLTGDASVSDYQAALRDVKYSTAPDTPSGSRTISFRADDGEAANNESNVVTRDITVTNSDAAPTDIGLSPSSIDENGAAGDDVGTLSTTDPDAGDTHSYSLVSGTGSTDNGSFQIVSGNIVEAKAGFDFETKSSYSIRVRTDDGQGGTFEEQLTIAVNDVNDAPTDLALSNAFVAENSAANTVVGELSSTDQDAGATHTYSLVPGTGGTDNGSFNIVGDDLRTSAAFNFEAKSSYSVRVRTTDDGGQTFEEALTITVTDVNEAPTDLALSPSSVPEGQPSGTTVGTFSTTDPDAGDTHTYSLVSGTGDTDNTSFTVDGSTLKTNAVFDKEAKSSYSIRVRTTDALGLTYEEAVTVTVSDANDAPTDIALSNASVAENTAQGTDVGTLSTTDQDGGSHNYSLVSGTGDTDNGSFQINGSTLEVKTPLNFEAGSTRSVRIQTSDGGETFSKQFTITVTNVNEAPTNLALSPATVAENQASGTTVGALTTTDPDAGGSHTYTLVSGTGDTDNGSFQIDGTNLETNAVFDYETKASYSIRVETDDGAGGTFEKQLTVGISDVNESPTDLALNDQNIAENAGAGAAVGSFTTTDPDAGDTHTYSLVIGTGDTDNGSFQIDGSALEAKNSLDKEADDSYSVRVRTTDALGLTYEEAFTITVTDANDAPTDISLSSTTFTAGLTDTTVGTLSTTDQDAGDTHTYALVTGAGDTHNGSFQIDGDTLKTDGALAPGNYSVRIQTNDGNGGTFAKQFLLTASPNSAPTDIALDNTDVDENTAQGTDVGALSTTDTDGGDSHTYTLVSGTGDTDNGSFQINGTTLEVKTPLNFEAGGTRSVRIQTDDGNGGTFQEQFTITVNDVNDVPTDIALSPASINENAAANSTVGTLSTTDQDGGSHTYTKVSGTGDTDNAAFTIDGTSLKINSSPDFETKSSYSVRIQTDDGAGGTFSKQFTITINDVNEFPTDIALSPSSVDENQPTGTTVGAFTTTDPDGGGTFTYTLVPGTGDTDNGSFQVDGANLETNAVFNFESDSSYSIRVKVTDGNGGSYEEALTVGINNVNDPPTDIALSPSSVNENVAANSAVGTLSTTDQDTGDTHTYTKVSGAGDTDNGSFTIDGTTLRINSSPNFETKSSYSVRIQTSDGTATFTEQLTVTVNNLNETPTDLALSPANVDENLAVGTEVGAFTTTDPDAGDTFTYTKVSGTGDTDNGSFTIDGTKLETAASFNYEAKNSYTVRIRTTDAGGAFYEEAFTVSINDVNEAPVPGGDTYNGVGNTELILSASGTTKTPAQAAKEITGSVLTNDTDPDQPAQTLTTTPQNNVATNHISGTGRVTIDNAGHFNYTPPTGIFTGTDTFNYTVSDGTLTAQGTVTVNLANQVWYVKNNALAGGTGRSTDPFDTIGEAETAHSGTGGTTFVYTGSGTTTGLDTGFGLETNQRLLGDRVALVVGGDTLIGAQGGNGPTLTDTGADVVTLASGSTLSGLVADPGTGGGGVSGTGVAASTIDKVRITDATPFGNQPGLELDGTSGNVNVSDLVVNNSNASGVRLNANTGIVNFADAGTISITTAGAKGLDANSTNMGAPSKFDDITVTGSGVGGVNLDTTSGTTNFGDLSLTTSVSPTAAFRLNGASTVSVPTGGTDNINANGGPAVEQTGATDATLTFDGVSSTNSTTTGIALGYVGGSGSFVAGSGDIKGATTFSVDVNGGNGAVTYPGGIGDPGAGTNDGNANAARIQNRTGGTVTLSGNIDDDNDSGGGISLAGNNSGTSSTVISGTSKKIDTTGGAGNAVVMGTSPNHTLTISGGGLEIDTASGKGLEATGGGTINVAGTGNSIATTTGTPVNVSGTTIGGSGVVLHDVSSNGAANGIVLSNTGTTGSLSVTGDNLGSGTSGGTIANATGHAISLNNTENPLFSNVAITSPQHAGVKGALVDGFTFKNGSISSAGAALSDGKDAAFAFNDTTGAANQNLTGVVAIFGNSITNPYGAGIDIFNYLGTISDANITGNTITSSTSGALSNEDGISVQVQGTSGGSAKLTKGTINNNSVSNFPNGNGIVVSGGNATTHTAPATDMGEPSGSTPGAGTNIVTINNNIIHGDPATKMGGEGILIGPNGRGRSNFTVSNNDIENVKGVGIGAGGSGDGVNNASITSNNMTNLNNIAGNRGLSIGVGRNQQANAQFVDGGTFNQIVTGNTTTATSGSGLISRITNSNVTQNLRVTGNNWGSPTVTLTPGMRIDVGTSNDPALDPTLCAQIGGAGALGNTSGTSPPDGDGDAPPGILLFKRSGSATTYVFGIVGLTPSPANGATTEAYVTTQNPNSALGAGFWAGKKVSSDAPGADNFTSCTLPF